ncbi:hypothetical protein Agub_g15239, partial [Astrephomene gubernaculifera]
RAGYYRARSFKTQIAARPATPAAPAAATAAATGAAASTPSRNPGGAIPGPGTSAGQQAATAPSSACRYVDLATRMTEQFEVSILAGGAALGPWRVLRLQATGPQEDGVHRLCVRSLRMYGTARIDLMQQYNGFVVQPEWILPARVDCSRWGGSTGSSGSGGVGSGTVAGVW